MPLRTQASPACRRVHGKSSSLTRLGSDSSGHYLGDRSARAPMSALDPTPPPHDARDTALAPAARPGAPAHCASQALARSTLQNQRCRSRARSGTLGALAGGRSRRRGSHSLTLDQARRRRRVPRELRCGPAGSRPSASTPRPLKWGRAREPTRPTRGVRGA